MEMPPHVGLSNDYNTGVAVKSVKADTSSRARHLVILVALLLSACASGASQSASGFDAFLDTISKKCGSLSIAGEKVSELVKGPYPHFVNATARLYNQKIDADSYRDLITKFFDNSPTSNQAVDCIVGNLPPASAR